MYNFNALLSRTKYLNRWSLMRQNNTENVAQHTTEVMFIAHTLCGIANKIYNKNLNYENIVICALYHDISEILTGDMPTPVKYKDAALKNAYKDIEDRAVESLLSTQQEDIKDFIKPYTNTNILTDYEKLILKSSDKLSALIKTIEEINSGNKEFIQAHDSILKSLQESKIEEVDYFIKNMIPSYNLCLDELARI